MYGVYIVTMAYRKNFIDSINITKELSYLLGWIWSDGYLNKDLRSFNITMVTEDSIDIKLIIEQCFPTVKEYSKRRFNPTHKPTSVFSVHSAQFSHFLAENDFRNKSQESPNKILAHIKSENQYLFWRGVFEGDGSIYFKKNKIGITITSTFQQKWDSLELFASQNNIKYSITRKANFKNSYSRFVICSRLDCIRFLETIYKDNLNLTLKRKYDKLLLIKKYYRQFIINNLQPSATGNKWRVTLMNDKQSVINTIRHSKTECILMKYNKIRELNTDLFQLSQILQITEKDLL